MSAPGTVRVLPRGRRAGWAAGVLLCYGLVLVARGHGIAPAALLLAVEPAASTEASVLGGVGVALVALSLVPRVPKVYAWMAFVGMFCLGLSLLTAMELSEIAVLTLVTMIPFIAVCGVWASRMDVVAAVESTAGGHEHPADG